MFAGMLAFYAHFAIEGSSEKEKINEIFKRLVTYEQGSKDSGSPKVKVHVLGHGRTLLHFSARHFHCE